MKSQVCEFFSFSSLFPTFNLNILIGVVSHFRGDAPKNGDAPRAHVARPERQGTRVLYDGEIVSPALY